MVNAGKKRGKPRVTFCHHHTQLEVYKICLFKHWQTPTPTDRKATKCEGPKLCPPLCPLSRFLQNGPSGARRHTTRYSGTGDSDKRSVKHSTFCVMITVEEPSAYDQPVPSIFTDKRAGRLVFSSQVVQERVPLKVKVVSFGVEF